MPSSAERMSRVDTAWLRMDNDVNLMMIVGVWVLDRPLGYDAFAARVKMLGNMRGVNGEFHPAEHCTWPI